MFVKSLYVNVVPNAGNTLISEYIACKGKALEVSLPDIAVQGLCGH